MKTKKQKKAEKRLRNARLRDLNVVLMIGKARAFLNKKKEQSRRCCRRKIHGGDFCYTAYSGNYLLATWTGE